MYTATTTVTVDPITFEKRQAQPTLPTYATPCSGVVRYTSACSCIGVSSASTVTAPTSTSWVTLPTTLVASVTATSVVSTSIQVVYVATNTVTVTDAPATISLIATETVTKTPAPPAGPTDVFANDGFEAIDSLSPWFKFGSSLPGHNNAAISTSVSRSGSQSAVIQITMSGISGIQQRVSVDANQNYRFSIWARMNAPACLVLYVGCGTSTASHPSTYFAASTTLGSQALNTWKELSVTCNWTPELAENASVSAFLPNGCTPGRQIFYDDASLVKV